MALLFFVVNKLAYQVLIIEKHNEGQDRLLDYVIELRNELKNYQILPYALADNPTLLAFMKEPNEQAVKKQMQRQLEDLTQVSKTQDWFILSAQGKEMLSSEQSPNFQLEDYFNLADLSNTLKEHQGEYLLISGYNPTAFQSAHLALAPVYNQTGQLSGAIAVKINVSDLIERWNLLDDLVVMTDQNELVFVANKLNRVITSDWLNTPKAIQFLDHTNAKTYHLNDQHYLLQDVLLDDLKWQIHYLSSLNNIQKKTRNIAWISLGIFALIFVFWLYRRERSLKIASKLENQHLIANSVLQQRVLIENTHVGLLLLTNQGHISFVNPMGKRYFGEHHQLISHNLMVFLPERPENQTARRFLSSLSRGDIHNNEDFLEQEVILQKHNGDTFPALLSVSPLQWNHSLGYLVTLLNISKRKRAELSLLEANARLEDRVLERTQALQIAQKELLRTEKLAAIGQMSTAIAHELNQPLTGIRTLTYTAELLLKRQDSEQALKVVSDLESLVVRMQKLTSELKVFAYRRPEQLAPTSISQCFQNALHHLGEETQGLTHQLQSPGNDLVLAEPSRLEQIFSNLISNTIQACNEANIKPIIDMSLSSDERYLLVEFKDNGPGIEEDKLAHIFEPFFTTKPIGKGLGLGMAISANLAKDMNGKLHASYNEAAELVFRLSLLKA
ncbi:PAS/PAC sensor signal transduction histidine kinase [Marinomonas posidonica IVIA-Po-181]|uniref:histidine kinase n=2 Tax=Marinomonas TaxID=28253 RepID=F6CVD4_MARPP|nr:PAS/PAC sensor signal transduction histidine kinase [Marinomonas posidonica IVIA-Po-181]